MPDENRFPLRLTILDQVMHLREGHRLMDWVPEPVLIMQVYLALANAKHGEHVDQVKARKRHAALASSMNFRRFDLDLRDRVQDGYLEASEREERTVSFEVDGEEMKVLLPADLDLVAGWRYRVGSRRIRFEVEESGMGPLRLKGLIDDEVVWSRTYETFPATSYRLTTKGRDAWAEALAETSRPSQQDGLSETTLLPLHDLMKEIGIPEKNKGAFQKRLERARNGPEGRDGYTDNPSKGPGEPDYLWQVRVARKIATRHPDLTA